MVLKRKQQQRTGAPSWTYVAGAIVAVAGLVWGMVSYFIPKPEPPKAASSTAIPTPSVTVSGSGNTGVGVMSGGQIVNGAVPPASSVGGSAK